MLARATDNTHPRREEAWVLASLLDRIMSASPGATPGGTARRWTGSWANASSGASTATGRSCSPKRGPTPQPRHGRWRSRAGSRRWSAKPARLRRAWRTATWGRLPPWPWQRRSLATGPAVLDKLRAALSHQPPATPSSLPMPPTAPPAHSPPLSADCEALRRAIARSIAHGKRNIGPGPLGARWEHWRPHGGRRFGL